MMRKIILINGKAGSGKDFVADWLVENKGFTKLKFGDKLKELASDLHDIPVDVFNTQDGKKSVVLGYSTGRQVLINLAKQIKKNDIYYFVKHIKTEIDKLFENGIEKIVIPDFRYLEEYYYLLTYYIGCMETFKLERKNHEIFVFDLSENCLDKFRFHKSIINPGDETFHEYFSSIFTDY